VKRLLHKPAFAVIASYVVASYAYSGAFALSMRDPSSHPFGILQIALFAVSPIWFLLHICLVMLCTISGARGGWNAVNTVSSAAFVAAFCLTYCVARVLRAKIKMQ